MEVGRVGLDDSRGVRSDDVLEPSLGGGVGIPVPNEYAQLREACPAPVTTLQVCRSVFPACMRVRPGDLLLPEPERSKGYC